MTRLGCIADLHLGKPAGYPGRLEEQRDVVIKAFKVFNENGCDAVLVAGDIFEGPLPYPEHYAAFNEILASTRKEVIAVLGNGRHDAATKDTNAPSIVHNLTFYDTPGICQFGGFEVACLPWTPITHLVASENGTDRDTIRQKAAQHLLTIARGLRERISTNQAAVLLTHFPISGGTDGLERFDPNPVLPVDGLADLGFDAVCAGHFHRPEILNSRIDLAPPGKFIGDKNEAPIFFCGSPYPLDFGEGGYEHGCWILDVEPGRAEARFVPLRSRELLTIDLRPEDYETIDEHGWPTDLNKAVVRLRYTATREQAARIDNTEIARALFGAGAFRVTVQPTILPDQRARIVLDEYAPVTDAVGLYLEALDVDGATRLAMREQHERYAEEVGA